MAHRVKLLILGIDGASHRVVRDQFDSLTNIARICNKSKWGVFVSEIPKWSRTPYTGPAWTSIYTGVDHKRHGISTGGWLTTHKGLQDINITNIWEIISRHHTLGIMTMPVTYPAFPLNGWMVSGFPSPRSLDRAYYPDWAISHMGEYFFPDYSMLPRFGPNAKSFEDLRPDELMRVEREKVNALGRFMAKYPVEVVAIGFTMLDKYGHAFVQYPNSHLKRIYEIMNSVLTKVHAKIENINIFLYPELLFNAITTPFHSHNLNEMIVNAYRDMDYLIGLVLNIVDPDNIIIVSDHGISKYTTLHDLFGLFAIKTKADILEKTDKILKLTAIAPIVLDILNINHELGSEKMTDVEPEYTESQYKDIQNQLKSLGYL